MNAQDFKAGLDKLRRECDAVIEKEQEETQRRNALKLGLIFKGIQDAAQKGQKYIILGRTFGELDSYVLQVLNQSGCMTEATCSESQMTNNVQTGYRITWNPSK